jgi:hypothetical protein
MVADGIGCWCSILGVADDPGGGTTDIASWRRVNADRAGDGSTRSRSVLGGGGSSHSRRRISRVRPARSGLRRAPKRCRLALPVR